MKADVKFDWDHQTCALALTMERIEDVGRALDFVKDMAIALWPNVVIEDEPVTGHVTAARRQPVEDYTKPPAPGSRLDAVLTAARDLGKADAAAIADDLGIKEIVAAQCLGKLRKGGHLEGLE